MKIKPIIIEFIPRVFWIIEITILILASRKPELTLNHSLLLVLLGLFLLFLGFFLIIWSIKTYIIGIVQKKLIQAGPYKYIRHPMYTSMYFMLTGIGCLFFGQIWLIVLALFLPIWVLISLLEESHIAKLYPDKWLKYKMNSGMFLPKIKVVKY